MKNLKSLINRKPQFIILPKYLKSTPLLSLQMTLIRLSNMRRLNFTPEWLLTGQTNDLSNGKSSLQACFCISHRLTHPSPFVGFLPQN